MLEASKRMLVSRSEKVTGRDDSDDVLSIMFALSFKLCIRIKFLFKCHNP